MDKEKEKTNHRFCVDEEFWQKVKAKAKDHNMTPNEIFNRMLFVGDRVSDSEGKGGRVIMIEGGHLIEIKFYKNGNGQKPPQE